MKIFFSVLFSVLVTFSVQAEEKERYYDFVLLNATVLYLAEEDHDIRGKIKCIVYKTKEVSNNSLCLNPIRKDEAYYLKVGHVFDIRAIKASGLKETSEGNLAKGLDIHDFSFTYTEPLD